MKGIKWVFSLVVICLVVLVSLSQAQADTLVYGHQERIVTLDPQMSLDISVFNTALHIFDPLVRFDHSGQLEMALATSVVSKNPLTWEIELRKGVKFHNGEEFNAQSVKYTLERLLDPDRRSPQAVLWSDIKRVEVVNDYRVVVHTEHPIGSFMHNLSITAMLPPSAGETKEFADAPIGTGPFKFEKWERGYQLILKSNENYWGAQPGVDTLIWREIPEPSTRMSALETGEIHLADKVPPQEIARLERNPNIELQGTYTFRTRFMWMNSERQPFDNPYVRLAVRYAIDTESILTHIMDGKGVLADSSLAPGVFGYTEMIPFAYDPELSKILLEMAGYPDGLAVDMKYAEIDAKSKEVAEAIAYFLEAVGIRVNLVQQDSALWVNDLLALKWDLNLAATTSLTGDADFTLRRVYHSTAGRTGYSNPALDRLLELGQKEVDVEKRREVYQEVNRILWYDGPTYWLFYDVVSYGVNGKVQGFVAPPSDLVNLTNVSFAK